MEQFILKVGWCFALISNHLGGFDLFVTGRRHFLLSQRSLSFNNVMITLTSAQPSAQTVELASGSKLFAKIISRLQKSQLACSKTETHSISKSELINRHENEISFLFYIHTLLAFNDIATYWISQNYLCNCYPHIPL